MTDEKIFTAPGINLNHLVVHLAKWLDDEGFESQRLQDKETIALQARKKGTWRNLLGMSSALTIKLQSDDRSLRVEMGAAKWVDKAVAGAIGMLVFWPLAVTTVYGSWEQMKLPQRVFQEIEQYIYVWSARAPGNAVSQNAVLEPQLAAESFMECPGCHKQIPAMANFCEFCGQKTNFRSGDSDT
ncbi:MAG TPA: hypothetical protein PLG75_06965 [Methanoculleus sp.]|nr:hypothetical protein [Methanoculleus sp.]